jgi:hypothetical protein
MGAMEVEGVAFVSPLLIPIKRAVAKFFALQFFPKLVYRLCVFHHDDANH